MTSVAVVTGASQGIGRAARVHGIAGSEMDDGYIHSNGRRRNQRNLTVVWARNFQ